MRHRKFVRPFKRVPTVEYGSETYDYLSQLLIEGLINGTAHVGQQLGFYTEFIIDAQKYVVPTHCVNEIILTKNQQKRLKAKHKQIYYWPAILSTIAQIKRNERIILHIGKTYGWESIVKQLKISDSMLRQHVPEQLWVQYALAQNNNVSESIRIEMQLKGLI